MRSNSKILKRVEINLVKFKIMKKFSKLSFNKKTVAKLNEEQLSTVKGGNNSIKPDGDCSTTSTTKNCSTTSTTHFA